MWYDRGTKIVVAGGVGRTPARTNLNWRFVMDTVPHHASNDNPEYEHPLQPVYNGRRTGLRYHSRGTTQVIYGLADPRTGGIRYIGKTNNLLARFNEHLRLNGPNSRKHDWLREILDAYMLPYMVTLEVVDPNHDAREREVTYIRAYLKAGIDLLNDEVERLQEPEGSVS